MDAAARQAVAGILRQTREYLGALKEDGATRVDVSLEAAARLSAKPTPPEAAVRPSVRQPAVAPAPSRVAPRPMAAPSGAARPAVSAPPLPEPAAPGDPAVVGLGRIASVVARCAKCPLHKERMRTVPGQGNPHPEILFVGEGPGADEDRQGVPFVGEAGQLLTKMIEAMGLKRDDVFLANIVKCRPPANRTPAPDEIAACLPYLHEQIALLQPKVIVALGAVASQSLLGVDTRIGELRGQWRQFGAIDMMPTYHPAYLVRLPAAKHEAWADLQGVLKRLGRTAPPRREARP